METYRDSPTTHVNNRVRKTSKKLTLEEIIQEYRLKRGIFNPKSPSPNVFMTKLERRMRIYYNSLYNSTKRRNM
jgi:hypothetical protein